MAIGYVIAYVLCSASACQLAMPDSSARYASTVECEGEAPGLPGSYSQPGALATRVCVAVPGDTSPVPKQGAPAQRQTDPDEAGVPDAATEALNARQMQLLQLQDSR